MIKELNRKLEKAASLMARKKRFGDRLARLREEEILVIKQTGALYRQLREEDQDVERLKKMSLSNLLLELQGVKDNKLRKEKQEALEAMCRYKEAKQRQQEVQAEVASVQAELKRYKGVEAAYKKLLKEKQKHIHAANGDAAEELGRLIVREEGLMERLQELEEVLEAGERAYSLIVQCIGFQRKAYKTGMKDMVGYTEHKVIASEDKHTYILRARLMSQRVRGAFERFCQTLGGVSEKIELPEMRIDESLKAWDCSLYGDGFFVDFLVQSKIKGMLEDTQAAHDRHRALRRPLHGRDREAPQS